MEDEPPCCLGRVVGVGDAIRGTLGMLEVWTTNCAWVTAASSVISKGVNRHGSGMLAAAGCKAAKFGDVAGGEIGPVDGPDDVMVMVVVVFVRVDGAMVIVGGVDGLLIGAATVPITVCCCTWCCAAAWWWAAACC